MVAHPVTLGPAPGCQPTYEELKQLQNYLEDLDGEGCQPTYEELKPKMEHLPHLAIDVASLPMRN